MLSPNDISSIRQLIRAELDAFERKHLAFRSRKPTDTATDKKTAAPQSQVDSTLSSYMPTSGGTFSGNVKFAAETGFNNTAPIAKPTVTGSKSSNVALASLMTALSNYGLVTDSTT
jgi:hypothetical protein